MIQTGVLSSHSLIKLEWDSQEVRAVERRVLLETLANQLPPDSVLFNSKLTNISKSGNGETLLELVDGTQLSAKVILNPPCSFVSNILYK